MNYYCNIINEYKNCSVLVFGDLMLDKYIIGNSQRIAPEAPVPVVDVRYVKISLGGAANCALNFSSLGAEVTFLSIGGDDEECILANDLLCEKNIVGKLFKLDGYTTNVKTRVISDGQVLVRYDVGTLVALDVDTENKILEFLDQNFHRYDIFVVSDYNKGIFTPKVIQKLEHLAKQQAVFIAIDSKNLCAFSSIQPYVVKPNYSEVISTFGMRAQNVSRINQIKELGSEIFKKFNSTITAVTLDKDGAVYFVEDRFEYRGFANSIHVNQVSGAGDAFFSAMTLSLFLGASIQQTAEISSTMAAVAISKESTAHCSKDELLACFTSNQKIIYNKAQLKSVTELYKSQGKTVVFTNGCFDILHSGHVNFLTKARELGDILILAVNTDESISRIKGQNRPINSLAERIEVLSGLSSITHLFTFGESGDSPLEIIEVIKPHVYVKGGNFLNKSLEEAPVVTKHGGTVSIIPLIPEVSTSITIDKILKINELN